MVNTIDRAVAVVPKGALLVEASRKIRLFRNFEGLTAEAVRDLQNYFHFRNPESIQVRETNPLSFLIDMVTMGMMYDV